MTKAGAVHPSVSDKFLLIRIISKRGFEILLYSVDNELHHLSKSAVKF